MTPCFVRARLRRDVPAAALAALLVPEEANARLGAAHRLVWALFADGPERRRDFLWREIRPGEFLALSARPPVDAHGLFDLASKPFAPVLHAGQQLGYDLRVNPVVSGRPEPGRRGSRHDAVMHALHSLQPRERPGQREALTRSAAAGWLARQGERHGFEPDPRRLEVIAYDQVRLAREGGAPIVFSALTVSGVLTVREPARFLARVLHGFGRARAFGCGLMLIRRFRAA